MLRGLGFLLDTMSSLLEHCSAWLVMVGEARIRVELEAQAESLGAANCMKFEGWRQRAQIKNYILASDFCLIPPVECEETGAALPHKLFLLYAP